MANTLVIEFNRELDREDEELIRNQVREFIDNLPDTLFAKWALEDRPAKQR